MKTIGKLDRTGIVAIIIGLAVCMSTVVCRSEQAVPTPRPTFIPPTREATATLRPTATPPPPATREDNKLLYGGVEVTHVLSWQLLSKKGVRVEELTDPTRTFFVLKAPDMDTGLYLGSFSYNVVLGNIYLLSDPTTETRVETEYRHSCLESAYKLCRWYEIEVIIERGQIGFLTHDLGRRDELLK